MGSASLTHPSSGQENLEIESLTHQQVVESLVIGAFPLQGLVTHYNAL